MHSPYEARLIQWRVRSDLMNIASQLNGSQEWQGHHSKDRTALVLVPRKLAVAEVPQGTFQTFQRD